MVATILINKRNIGDKFYSQYQENANKLGWSDFFRGLQIKIES